MMDFSSPKSKLRFPIYTIRIKIWQKDKSSIHHTVDGKNSSPRLWMGRIRPQDHAGLFREWFQPPCEKFLEPSFHPPRTFASSNLLLLEPSPPSTVSSSSCALSHSLTPSGGWSHVSIVSMTHQYILETVLSDHISTHVWDIDFLSHALGPYLHTH